MPKDLDRLTAVDPREVWENEATAFTPWLLRNEDILADVLGLDIELTGREHQVGGYFLDLIGIDITNDCPLVVENQLTRTDHGHLGQLLTYAAGTTAKTVVWVAPEFREEHRQAIDFLNEISAGTARFFAVELKVVRIGDSLPAPMLRAVAQPSSWNDANSSSPTGQLYVNFWSKLVAELGTKLSGRVPKFGPRNWMVVHRLAANASICCTFGRSRQMRVELYIGGGSALENRELFDSLREGRTEIEEALGSDIAWEELDGKKACRVALYRDGDVAQEDQHSEYIEWMLSTAIKFKEAFTSERLFRSIE